MKTRQLIFCLLSSTTILTVGIAFQFMFKNNWSLFVVGLSLLTVTLLATAFNVVGKKSAISLIQIENNNQSHKQIIRS